MREQLIAYLLNDLSADERFQVEECLRQDPRWQQELERLTTCLQDDENDAEAVTNPPQDLTLRTCHLVQNTQRPSADQQLPVAHSLPANSDLEPAVFSPKNVPLNTGHHWSLLDLTIAAGILATLAMVLLPALHSSRESARRVVCKNNLHDIGRALLQYAYTRQDHGRLPQIAPHENAGSYTMKLVNSGMIEPRSLAESSLCPSSPLAEEVYAGKSNIFVPTDLQLAKAKPAMRLIIRKRMSGSYAYRLGHYVRGIYYYIRFTERSDSPMLADAPAQQDNGFYSSYHGGCGKNRGMHILSQDWSVRFVLSSRQGDDPYLNFDQQQAAGKGPEDIVMGLSDVRPDGLTFTLRP